MNLQEGQTIYLKPIGNAARRSTDIIEATIAKIGKKYFQLNIAWMGRFHLDSMVQDAGKYSPDYAAYLTKNEIEEEAESHRLYSEIRKHFSGYSPKLKLQTLRTISELLNSDKNVQVSDTTGAQ